MKKILKILYLTTLFSLKLAAQNWPPVPGSYTSNNTMTGFHGKWLWTDGTDSVTLVLQTRKVFFRMNVGFFWDRLVGWHEYKRKGIIVESSLVYIGDSTKRILMGGNEAYGTNIARVSFNDITKKKSGNLFLTLDTTVIPNSLTWVLKNDEGIRVRTSPSQPLYDWNFTLPRNMILIKQ